MPFLAVDIIGVFRSGFLPANLPLRSRDVRRIAVGVERLAPLVLDGLVEIPLLLMHHPHRLQPLDRIAAHVPVPVADSRRMRRFQATMRGLIPGLLMRTHVRTHGHGRAIETMMLVQEVAGDRRGRAAADRASVRVRDRVLQD